MESSPRGFGGTLQPKPRASHQPPPTQLVRTEKETEVVVHLNFHLPDIPEISLSLADVSSLTVSVFTGGIRSHTSGEPQGIGGKCVGSAWWESLQVPFHALSRSEEASFTPCHVFWGGDTIRLDSPVSPALG